MHAGDSTSNFTYFTFYNNICTMEFMKGDMLMTSPPSSILITRNDGSSNRVYLDVPGSKEFFEGLQNTWREHTAIP